MAKIAALIVESCVFPSDFTKADVDKFTGEVASEVGKFLPKGECEDLVEEVTASSKALTFKLEKVKHKAEKGEKVQYTFRLSLYLQLMAMRKISKVTGYRAHTLDLSACEFWTRWKRAEVVDPAPATAPAPAPAS